MSHNQRISEVHHKTSKNNKYNFVYEFNCKKIYTIFINVTKHIVYSALQQFLMRQIIVMASETNELKQSNPLRILQLIRFFFSYKIIFFFQC